MCAGAPWENGFAESFFCRLRDELLNVQEFTNLAEAQWFAKRRKEEYNEERPHSSLGYQTPSEYAAAWGLACSATLRNPNPTRLPEEPTLITPGT